MRQWLLTVLGLAVVAAIFWAAYLVAERFSIRSLRESTAHRLDIYAASLQAEMNRFEHLPPIVALNERVVHLLRNASDPASRAAANQYLQTVNAQAGASAVYVMDAEGLTLAASNWNQPASFVAMNFAYRPYFQDALKGQRGRFYGIGTVSREPGYYFTHPVTSGGQVLGVVAVKFSLEKLDQAWGHEGEKIAVADGNGVIFLTSEPNWKYRTLKGLSREAKGRLEATRQYSEAGLLTPLGIQQHQVLDDGSTIVGITAEPIQGRQPDEATEFLVHESRVLGTDWRLLILSELNTARASARVSATLAALTGVLLALLAVYLQQRRRFVLQTIASREALQRANDELEEKVAERTAALRDANHLLQAEVGERERAENALRAALQDLVHTAKMAALGQMSAGITHELNQPLAALRTLSSNAVVFLKRGDLTLTEENLNMIVRVTGHMGRITSQLKKFARKAPIELRPVVVAAVVVDALFLLSQSMQDRKVRVDHRIAPADLQALCDANRLEQVLLNLLVNAFDAVEDARDPRVLIEVCSEGDAVLIAVHDNGPGIQDKALPHLFEPFYSTKAQGVGLGLGLAISADIVRELGGAIRASVSPELGGALFTVQLKAVIVEPTYA